MRAVAVAAALARIARRRVGRHRTSAAHRYRSGEEPAVAFGHSCPDPPRHRPGCAAVAVTARAQMSERRSGEEAVVALVTAVLTRRATAQNWVQVHVPLSAVVTALPRFARPGRDWIHHESLASDEVWQVHRSGVVPTSIARREIHHIMK